MKLLSRMIRSLNKEEIRGFRLFTDRIQSAKYDKKLVDLFDLLRSGKFEEGDKALIEKLYGKNNANAYYRLKHRLVIDLERSLLLQHHILDERVKVLRYNTLARIFLLKTEYKTSHEYYLKAAKQAMKMGFLDLEISICEELQHLANYTREVDLEEVISYKNNLLQAYLEKQKIEDLLQLISQRLKRNNFDGRNQQLTEALNQIQSSLELLPQQLQDAGVKLKINKCVREALLGKKDFKTLESYLIESYREYREKGVFNAANHKEKVVILSWIVNTLAKNRRFEASQRYTEELGNALQEYNQLLYHQYIWTYYQGQIFNFVGTAKLEAAIQLLLKIQKEHPRESIPAYDLFIVFNLARLYFDQKEYAQATTQINLLLHSETFAELDKSYQLTISLGELILRLEMRDWDYATYRLKEFKRKFRALLNEEAYAVEAQLIKIIHIICRNMSFRIDKKLDVLVEAFLEQSIYEVGSNEFISYKAWIFSKKHQRDYYGVILEWLKQ
ncbi:MAG: hypothetical protein AAF927_02595 [Bacteroidota bacterium]